jgi:hypothetical protein
MTWRAILLCLLSSGKIIPKPNQVGVRNTLLLPWEHAQGYPEGFRLVSNLAFTYILLGLSIDIWLKGTVTFPTPEDTWAVA